MNSNSITADGNVKMPTAQVIPFRFEAKQVRTCVINDQPWFVAADVCQSLGIVNTARALVRLDDDEKGVHSMNTPGGAQNLSTVNESGLYSLILTSRKVEAKRFKKWVTAEVLPAIRKHGSYTDTHNKMGTLIGETIGTNGFNMLGALIKGKVVSLPAHTQRKATAKIWSQTHAAFGVRSAADIPATNLDAARNFIAAYALEGEWLPKAPSDFSDDDWLNLNALVIHMGWVKKIYSEYDLYSHFKKVGSPVGGMLHDHVVDGHFVAGSLRARHDERLQLASKRSRESCERALAR